jgi:hypothetical protein
MTYRLYAFVNQYMATIQHGIQTAHVVAELFCKYRASAVLQRWAEVDKTIIILCGGDNAAMYDLAKFLSAAPYPDAIFFESPDALNGLLTCCAVIVPEKLFGGTDLSDRYTGELTAWEAEFLERKEKCKLAI